MMMLGYVKKIVSLCYFTPGSRRETNGNLSSRLPASPPAYWSSRRLGRLVNSSPNRKSNWSTRRQMSSHWNCTICVFGNKCLMPGVWCDMLQFLLCECGLAMISLQLSINWLQLAIITVVQGWCSTLTCQIDVHVRLFILEKKSNLYGLIRVYTFIKYG